GAVDDPVVAIAYRARLAGRDVGATLGLGVTEAQPKLSRKRALEHFVLQLVRAELVDRPRDHGRCAPMEPGRLGPADLEIPDAFAHPGEAALGLRFEVGGQV